jgi:hypothetical protein
MFMTQLLCCTLLATTLCSAPKRYIPMKAASAKHSANECIIDEICETEYVGELLELCKDCELSAPEVVEPPSRVRVWFTRWGIALYYAAHDLTSWIGKRVLGTLQEDISVQPE